MKNKKWLLLFIIALPSLFWIILETSSINSYRLNYYGPKITGGSDTGFYRVNATLKLYSEKTDSLIEFKPDTTAYPFYILLFIKDAYKKEGYRIAGLSEYLLYKTHVIEQIPFFLVSTYAGGKPAVQEDLKKFTNANLKFLALPKNEFDSLNFVYFKQKPSHVDYSFLVLVDHKRNLRGYYDGRYAMEIKRLADEYKHLRLKNEKEKILQRNEIEKHEK